MEATTETLGNLIISRGIGDSVWIGDALVTVHRIKGTSAVSLRILAPTSVRIVRSELLRRDEMGEIQDRADPQ